MRTLDLGLVLNFLEGKKNRKIFFAFLTGIFIFRHNPLTPFILNSRLDIHNNIKKYVIFIEEKKEMKHAVSRKIWKGLERTRPGNQTRTMKSNCSCIQLMHFFFTYPSPSSAFFIATRKSHKKSKIQYHQYCCWNKHDLDIVHSKPPNTELVNSQDSLSYL